MSEQSWADVVAGEEATIYAYQLLIAELSGEKETAASDAILVHRQARDTARARLAEDGQSPPSPASYDLPFPVKDEATAVKLAVTVELRLVDQYLFQVAETTGADRRYSSESAQEGTIRATMWGWDTAAFPTGGSVTTGAGNSAASMPSPPAEPAEPSPLPVSQHDGASLQ